MDGDGKVAKRARKADAPLLQTVRYLRQYELVERVQAYHPEADEHALNAGYVFAVAKHGSQKRASGDPYFSHPVAVAGLLADMKLDEATIIAGLLHDTVEDTDATLEDIEALFGKDVCMLVNGVTKLGEIEYSGEASKQAENFQKFILATTEDIRVLLVKLADRLHNMRTLHFINKPEKRERIARETMDLYAPLARRIGLYAIASEMEDLSFAQINPKARNAILEELQNLSAEHTDNLERIRTDLYELLQLIGVEGRVEWRRKQPYSIWRKLERKSISFRKVADIFGFRVIIEHEEDCYRVLGAAHQQWECLEERFRDFISVPKPNGYRSLHTTVRGSGNRIVELQIRTETMHATAENGVAAHWGYKDSSYSFDKEAARKAGLDAEGSLKAFAELLENSADPDEFLEHAKLEMYRNHVFTFSPKGRIVILAQGAMALDFAYEVHTAVGETCIGVKINGEPKPLRTLLQNGDIVEIIRGEKPAPVPGWSSLAVTAKALAASRRLARVKETVEFIKLGRGLVEKALRLGGIDPVTVDMENTSRRAAFASLKAMYEAIGRGRYKTSDMMEAAFPGYAHAPERALERLSLSDETASVLVAGADLTPGITLHMGQCCSPLPGDRIIGLHTPEIGLVVHTSYCKKLAGFEDQMEDWVDLRWTELANTGALAVGRIHIRAANRKGVLVSVCGAVSEGNANITRIATGERRGDFIDLYLDVEVEDVKRLTQILAGLRSLAVVEQAVRILEEGEANDEN